MPITRQTYFQPTQITGCSLWLDSTDTSSLTGNSPVTLWKNKIIPANNIPVFATAGGSPSISATAINGNPAMYFNGSSYLTGAISGANTTTITIFIIGSLISPFATFSGLLCFGNPSQLDYDNFGSLAITMYGSDSKIYGYRNGDAQVVPVTANVPFMYILQHDGTYVNTFLNGTQQTSVNIASSGTFTYTNYSVASRAGTITGQYIWSGYLGEILVYQSSLTAPQRQQIEGYLAQKWGLTASLISGHPGLDKIIYRNLQTTFTKKQYFTAFSPRNIPGCSHWFDATDSSTITLSSGSLTQWNDKSGNGRNLTAVSGFANATVSSAFQNGLNVFNFSGNGLYRTALGNVSYPLEVYIIVALKSLTTHVDVLGMGDTATDNFNSLTFSESAAKRWHNGSSFGNRQTISTTDETSLSFLLIQWSIANGNYLLRRNGTQLIQASQTYSFNNSATAAFQIGFRHTNIDAANFSGYIGEIVVFNNQIGITDRQNVESYLAQKWGLVSSLPTTGHIQNTFPAGSPTAIQPYTTSVKTSLTNIAKATGGIITNVGGRRFHTFINNGTFSIVSAMPGKIFEVFAIGGGGGGGGFEGGGGGGGGLVTYTSSLSVGNYSITIGTGGTGGTASSVAGGNGTSTLFSSLVTAIGGGGGGSSFGGSPANGGCGGGGAYNQSYGTGSQGFNGAVASPSLYWGGGGGGTSASATNNNGGAGTLYYGSYYGGGGGGGGNQGPNGTGGIGGGGDGGGSGTPSVQYITPAPVAGAANTGGGGGGHGYNGTTGAIGGTGICIVSYIYP